ncbi:MAG: hypothetical protein WC314_23185 [Vulcanimicrobiota bacterium]
MTTNTLTLRPQFAAYTIERPERSDLGRTDLHHLLPPADEVSFSQQGLDGVDLNRQFREHQWPVQQPSSPTVSDEHAAPDFSLVYQPDLLALGGQGWLLA